MLTFCDSLAGKLHVIAEEKNEVGDGCCTISGSNLTNTPCASLCRFLHHVYITLVCMLFDDCNT